MNAIVEPGNSYGDRVGYSGTGADPVASRSAVSWGAVFAGAAAAAALSLILLLLGTGLGLSSVSPWATEGIDAEHVRRLQHPVDHLHATGRIRDGRVSRR